MINIDHKDERTIYQQIEEGIKCLIINGVMPPEEKLPSVKELSVSITVNPNTVRKAYQNLEYGGFIYAVKGKGFFVCSSAKKKRSVKYDDSG